MILYCTGCGVPLGEPEEDALRFTLEWALCPRCHEGVRKEICRREDGGEVGRWARGEAAAG